MCIEYTVYTLYILQHTLYNCINILHINIKIYVQLQQGWTENEGWFQSWGSHYDPNHYSGDSGESNNRSPHWLGYVVGIWFAAGKYAIFNSSYTYIQISQMF